MTELGEPITTEQAVWAILKEIDTPVVGDLTKYSRASFAFKFLFEDNVFNCLSAGEKRLVNIAFGIHTGVESATDSGVAAIGGLDLMKRRKVIMILAYLYLGRDYAFIDKIDFAPFERRKE